MLRLSDLVVLSTVLNIKELCAQAGLSYSTIFAKLKKLRSGETKSSELLVTEAEKLTIALASFGIVLDFETLRKPRTSEAVSA